MNFDKTQSKEEEEEKMPIYTCEKCARTFSQKSHYTSHQNKKIDCSSTTAINTVVQKLVDKEKIIVYKDWIESKTFPHLPLVGSANEVIDYFAESDMKLSNISYDKIRKLSLFNVDILNVDKSGSYYFNVPFEARFEADIIDNIIVSSTNNKMVATILLNGIEYELDKISELVIIAMPYVQMSFKISFSEKPSFEDEVIIKCRNYMLCTEDRKIFLSTIKTDMFTYKGGNIS
jgi:hypothetical protein